MSQINVQNLTFAYEGSFDTIFDHASFQLDTDWKLGFIGRNGRGKTTFLNLLMGRYPYEGRITASVDFTYFPFEPGESLSGETMAIEVVDQMIGDYEYWKLSRELSLLELSDEVLYRPWRQLSHGEQTKLQLAALFLRENSFLLIDEPTNHLDAHGRRLTAEYLNHKKGFILVSHDRSFLDGCIDHVLSINRASITVEKGNFSSWEQNTQARLSFEASENRRLKKEIDQLHAAAKRTSQWSAKVEKTKNGVKVSGLKPDKGHIGAQAAALMKRTRAIEVRQQRSIEKKSALLKDQERQDSLKLTPLACRSQVLVRAESLCPQYSTQEAGQSPGDPVCGPLTFQIERGERIALTGPNGSGKSTILKLILDGAGCGDSGSFSGFSGYGSPGSAGLPAAGSSGGLIFTGSLQISSGLIISHVPQTTAGLHGSLREYAAEQGIDESRFLTILRKMDFARSQFEKSMEDFSQGQKKKVLLAASLCRQAHLYIWDEPLNYVDVISRMQIEDLILQYEPTMLFVEHDQVFCQRAATRTINLP